MNESNYGHVVFVRTQVAAALLYTWLGELEYFNEEKCFGTLTYRVLFSQ